jgi:hypothetical protein
VAQETQSAEVQTAADQLGAALSQAIVAEKHGPQRPGATGLSIYFPTSEIYDETYDAYPQIASRFADQTTWDAFLTFHYTGEPMDAEAPPAATRAPINAPGASPLTIDELTLSDETIAQDESLIISTSVRGDHIGYVYSYLGYYDEESDSILIADMDFLDADATREVGGVVYPDWGAERPLEIEYEWEPTLYEISDGTDSAFALLDPETYAESDEETTYVTGGIYTFADTGNERYAELFTETPSPCWSSGFN